MFLSAHVGGVAVAFAVAWLGGYYAGGWGGSMYVALAYGNLVAVGAVVLAIQRSWLALWAHLAIGVAVLAIYILAIAPMSPVVATQSMTPAEAATLR